MTTQCHTTPTSAVTPFDFESQQIRIITVDGDPWFIAKDVAEAMDYVWNGAQRIAHVPEEWTGVTSVVTPGGRQEFLTLSEQGLYFFLGRSDKPKALPFQKWLAGQVLPSIRKTGSYQHPQSDVQEMLDKMLATIEEMGRELSKTRADAVMEIPAKEFAGLMKRLADSETFRAEILNAKLNPPKRQANRPLTPEAVAEIRRLHAEGMNQSQIARQLKRSAGTISYILRQL